VKTDVENLSATRVKIVVEVPFEELAEDLKNAYRTIGSQVNVPGFRKGKVPTRIIDQRFGRGAVLSEVANAVIPREYQRVVEDRALVPLSQPDVEVTKLEDGEVMEFVAEVDIRPDFEVPPLDSIAVQVAAPKQGEDLVEGEIDALRKRFASFNPVERAAQDGDVVLVDVAAVDAEGAEAPAYGASALSFEVGSTEPVEGFNDALRGALSGAELSLAHTPSEGPDAGKELAITISVTAVRERILPDLDDDFAALASEFDTLDELKDDLRRRAGRYQLLEQGQAVRTAVLDALLEAVEVEVPENLVANQLQEHFQDGHGDDEHRAQTEAELRKNLKTQFVLDKISETEALGVSEAELSQWLMSQASNYGMTPDDFARALVEAGQVQMALQEVRRGKALSLVIENAAVTDSEGNPVDMEELGRQLTMDSLLEQITELQGDEAGLDDDAEDVDDEGFDAALDAEDDDAEDADDDLPAPVLQDDALAATGDAEPGARP
jgi:trigger factor